MSKYSMEKSSMQAFVKSVAVQMNNMDDETMAGFVKAIAVEGESKKARREAEEKEETAKS